MRQKSKFDWYPEFKSKGIEFEVGDKYLFWQLTNLLIHQSCQACSSKPLANIIMKISQKTKTKIWRYEEVEELIKVKIYRLEIQPKSAILVESQGLLIRV
jgi:hypothetical protein